ncbi:hypothetical protein BOX15_Mlig012515g1 [Macrostomum lignano]|uniref:Hexosyltransferase n=1 Tax=Macrostomum lignano TaxID=282301 RepID=A0A267DCR6_9PLAT|nr:hypothetical protein BOX15_Mlig012515g1 [Macrostomum lignano]
MKLIKSVSAISRFTMLNRLQRWTALLLQLSLRHWNLLLLLMISLTLSAQLSFGSKLFLGRPRKQFSAPVIETEPSLNKGKSLKSISAEPKPELSGTTYNKPPKRFDNLKPKPPLKTTGEMGKDLFKEARADSQHIGYFLADRKHFILEDPFDGPVAQVKSQKGSSDGREHVKKFQKGSFTDQKDHKETTIHEGVNPTKEIEAQQPQQNKTIEPQTLMERIKRTSDSRLYSKLLTKLKSLGSAVTQQQLQSAAGKCGGLQSPALRYVQTYDFVRMADHLCTAGDLLALVAVHSNAKNLGRRATIRRTWGSLRYIGRYRIEVAFFLGRPASGDSDESGATGAQLEALIDAESDRFGDIVQLNYTENYRNMSIKHLAVYEWVLRHCQSAKYLVKVDDDTFTDVAHLATFLSQGAPSSFYCSATRGAKPQRSPLPYMSKWLVSYDEFPGSFYPTYCEGFGYILNAKHVASIYLCSLFKQFFWIDDVYVAGVLAASLDIPIAGFWRGHGYTTIVPSLASEGIVNYIFLTAFDSAFFDSLWVKLWQALLKYSLDVNL